MPWLPSKAWRSRRAGCNGPLITASGAPVYVDYSHKPDALKQALAALNRVVTGKVTVVFGCGGDRDAGKRPIMGAIAAAGADRVIVTDDNPRSEDPTSIRQAILQAAPNAEEIADRGAAIRAALEGVGPDDVVLIAGKGHEQGQIIGPLTMPFDDVEEAQAAVSWRPPNDRRASMAGKRRSRRSEWHHQWRLGGCGQLLLTAGPCSRVTCS